MRSNIVWNTLGNLVYLLSQWILTYVVVRLLGFEDAGIFSLAMTVASVFSVIAMYGMRSYQASDIERRHSFKVYLGSRVVTSALSVVLCLAFVLVNDYSLDMTLCIMAFMLYKALEAMSDVYQGFLQKQMRLDYVGKSFLIKGIVTFAVFFVTIMATKSLLFGICAICLAMFVVVVLYDCRKASSFEESHEREDEGDLPRKTLHLLGICLPLALYGLFFAVVGQAPRYFIELMLGAEALGFYASIAMPVALIQVSGSFIFTPLVTPMAKSLSAGCSSEFASMVRKVLLFLLLLAIVSAVLGFLLGDPVLVWAFGEEIEPYTYLLMPLVACAILTSLCWFLASVLTVLRQLTALLICSGLSMAIVLFACMPGITWWGMNGASFILAIALAVFSLGCFFVILRDMRRMSR